MKLKKIAAAVLAAAVLAATPAAGALLSPLSVTANAEDTLTEGDYSYTVNEDGETVTIDEYNGTETEVVIPGTLGGKNVTSIGKNAFYGCESLTSVIIPDSVTTIGYAFYGCTSLEKIEVSDTNNDYCSVDGVLFNKDKTELVCYSMGKKETSYIIPNSVTEIGSPAFCGCESLTSITIPNGVITIGAFAFEDCKSLTSVIIPNSVTTIGDHAFYGCTSLEKIEVSDTNNDYCSVDGVLFNKDKTELVCYSIGKKETSYIIPNSVTKIGSRAFYVCASLESVTIPDGVIEIDEGTFCGCTSLASVTIPDSVTRIGDAAFQNCTSLASVTIPDSVTSIGGAAFNDCTSLTSVKIPNSTTYMTDVPPFVGCTSLEEIAVGENHVAYSSIDGVLFNKGKTELLYYPPGKKATSYTIPDSVTVIGRDAFSYCISLTSVTIPDDVTEIGIDAFFECTSLTSVTIPDGVTEIRSGAFGRCASLASVTIPDSVTRIGDAAFQNCTSLASVTIPDSVTKIGWATFGNTILTTVNYGGTMAKWEAIEIDDFNECLTNAEIICIGGIINEREPDTSEPTSSDTSEPTSSDTSEPTSSDTSAPTSSDTSAPEALKPGDYFVDGGLEYTVLKDGTLEIRGFAGDEAKEIVIPETVKGKKVTSIGDAAFMDCISLTSVMIPDSVTKIGGYAFSGCTSLETVNYGGRKSDWEAIEIDIENEPLTNAEIKFAEQTVEIVDEDTGVKTEVSTEDKELDGAEFEANPADYPTLWDLIKKIIEKAVDTIESVTEKAQKSLEEAAEAVKNGKGFAYDMGFKKNGKEVQPDKSVTVTVPVPDKFKKDIDKLNVYHLTNRGAVYVPSWIKDSSIMFRTNSFSPYVITTDKLEYAVADENTTVTPGDIDTANSGGNESGSDQKSTGIALAIAPVVLAAGMAVVALSKKKK